MAIVIIEGVEKSRSDIVFLAAFFVCQLPITFDDIAGFQMIFVLQDEVDAFFDQSIGEGEAPSRFFWSFFLVVFFGRFFWSFFLVVFFGRFFWSSFLSRKRRERPCP